MRELATKHGRTDDPIVRQRLADATIKLRIMRYNALRSLTPLAAGEMTPLTAVHKLYWASFHRDLGALAMDLLGPDAEIADDLPYDLTPLQRLFLYTRADTIYGGANEI